MPEDDTAGQRNNEPEDAEKNRALARLNRIEGQLRGIRRMLGDNRAQLDIAAQTHSVLSALQGLQIQLIRRFLLRHFESHAPINKGKIMKTIEEIMIATT